MDSALLSYRIDGTDFITSVSDGWSTFALANDGAHLLPPAILGRYLWDMVSDTVTRQVYLELLRRTRQGTTPIRFRFRCDAPSQRRLLSMQMTATDDGGVEFATALVQHEGRTPMSLFDTEAPRNEEVLKMCAWCMRFPVAGGDWMEVEDAIPLLKLFDTWPLPRLTHGMCLDCYDAIMSSPDETMTESVTLGALI